MEDFLDGSDTGTDWFGGLSRLGQAAGGIFGSLNPPKAEKPKPIVPASTTPSWLMPVIIGGGVLLLAVVLLPLLLGRGK
ncbi:MAG TPA: hypothetical protein VK846_00675 [Candidatus Limnocylindria bacterium]|nr:hypothetical protein [Candidatus Limnocylindria bacterium]